MNCLTICKLHMEIIQDQRRSSLQSLVPINRGCSQTLTSRGYPQYRVGISRGHIQQRVVTSLVRRLVAINNTGTNNTHKVSSNMGTSNRILLYKLAMLAYMRAQHWA